MNRCNHLHFSWAEVEIGDVAEVKGGKRLPKGKSLLETPTAHPYIRVTDFDYGSVDISSLKYLNEETHDEIKNYTISKDDLYISIAGTIGLVGEIPVELDGANLTENAAKLCGLSGIEKSYLRYVLSSNASKEQFDDSTTSSGQPKLALFRIKNCRFPLPPLAEQKVIADKLDTLLAQVETTKARLDRIPKILKTFRQSVLAAAVSGKLTEAWRAQFSPHSIDTSNFEDELFLKGITHGNFGKKLAKGPSIGTDERDLVVRHIEGWPLVRVGSICQSVVPNRDKPKKFSGGYHWLLTPHFREHSIWIDYSKIEYGLSEQEVLEYKAKVIKSGNVIMSCVGRVGLSAVLEEDSVINQQLHAFIINRSIKAEYLAYCIRANVKYFEAQATSTTVSYLNKTSCNSLPIPLPSFEEQTQIVHRVEELFAFADRIEQKANAALDRVNSLTQSILAKAFRGELTADWRAQNPDLISGDNSAEALLAKIKAEREALSSKKKPKKKAGKIKTI